MADICLMQHTAFSVSEVEYISYVSVIQFEVDLYKSLN